MGHAGFEATESGEVGGLGGVVPGEGSDFASVVFCSLSGEEAEVSLSGATELSV